MENVNLKDELLRRLSDVIGDLKWVNTLLEDGKFISCHRKIQGVRTKVMGLAEIGKLLQDDIHVVPAAPQEQQ